MNWKNNFNRRSIRMSEEQNKLPETLKEIEQEYQKGCLAAGQIQYQKACLELDLGRVNQRLQALNNKAFGLKKEEAAKAEAVAPAPEVQAQV